MRGAAPCAARSLASAPLTPLTLRVSRPLPQGERGYLISDSSTPFVSRASSALIPLIAQAMAT